MEKHSAEQLSPLKTYNIKNVYEHLLGDMQTLLKQLLKVEQASKKLISKAHPSHKHSVVNLTHYLGLRRQELRSLQLRLSAVGLSSLGRSEADVLYNIESIIRLLKYSMHVEEIDESDEHLKQSLMGSLSLEKNTTTIFGVLPPNRSTRILVTLPTEAADDPNLIKEMILRGMNCARINCAHDDASVWSRMIDNIKLAVIETQRECKILMDLAGPKLRTGQIDQEPTVLKIQPKRNLYGHVIAPAKLIFHPKNYAVPFSADFAIPIQGDLLSHAKIGDSIELFDARGAKRQVLIVDKLGELFFGECYSTIYLASDIELKLRRAAKPKHPKLDKVGDLGLSEKKIRLYQGDILILTKDQLPGQPAEILDNDLILSPAKIACSLPEIFTMVKPGERILIDDGRIEGVIESANAEELSIHITQARDSGEKLLSDKGINLPESYLKLDALTTSDIQNLEFIVKHADMVGFSFCQSAQDVELLQEHLKRLAATELAIILKIETSAAFKHLPEMFFTLLRSPNVGVMIARGDLAVECGYERLAELQEEILCLAQAAHIPLIWATQVLEGVAKTGKPTRAEITDAAMSERAECVMLNKGPHVLEAIKMLDDILLRMQGHQSKKIPLLRQLHWE